LNAFDFPKIIYSTLFLFTIPCIVYCEIYSMIIPMFDMCRIFRSNFLLDLCIVRIVQDFFTQKGYQLLKKAVNELRERDKWSCPTCLQQCADNEEQWICCDACLYWYHLRCTGRTKLPKNHTFFCRACLARASK